jgi:opacity protein-like surface antigen
MRSVKFLIAAGAASLLSSAAFAADMPSIMPPPPMQPYYAPPPQQDFGGWYLRGDIGMTNSTATLFNNNYATVPAGGLQQLGEGFNGGMSYGLGVGYQFNSWFRADITGEYRSRVGFTGTDIATFPGEVFSDVYQGGYKAWVGLVNVYADLGTWWCITPFIGAGVGAASVTTTGLQDSGSNFTAAGGAVGGASYFANGASTTNLAWAVHAGLAYHVNRNFTVELAYRYLDMGNAVHGFGNSFDGTNAGPSSFQFRDLTSQDIKIGVRWTCCDVEPPPPPLIRKG